MGINPYGVWRGTAKKVRGQTSEEDDDSPHIHLYFDDHRGKGMCASINVKSQTKISGLAHYRDGDFKHPIVKQLQDMPVGWHVLDKSPDSGALDYLRGDLFDLRNGRLLPHDVPGRKNDLLDLILPVLRKACAHGSTVWIYGERFDDWKGIHNIHMNQGSEGKFASSDGIWQDGGLIIEDRSRRRLIALFLAFGSQATETDAKGHAQKGAPLFMDVVD